MTNPCIRELSDGDHVDLVLLVRDKQVRTNRNGSAYLQLELNDKTGSIGARYWNVSDSETRAFDAGDFVRVKGKVQLFQGQLQLIAQAFERCRADEADLEDFIPASDASIESLLAELRQHLGRVEAPPLKALANAYLIDERFLEALCRAPAGIRHHHAYLGGLLEHIVSLLRVADRIVDLYPAIDPDLLRMGIFLHDLGKVRELMYDKGFIYSDEGQLIGHVVIGVEMLDEKLPLAAELLGEAVPAELVLRLKHMIVSHHGTYEFGSPKLPMTPEAIALHHLDNLDAKVHNFSRTIQGDMNPASAWTPFDPQTGRRLFKGTASNGASSAALFDRRTSPSSGLKGGL